jgi:hypothetical protein
MACKKFPGAYCEARRPYAADRGLVPDAGIGSCHRCGVSRLKLPEVTHTLNPIGQPLGNRCRNTLRIENPAARIPLAMAQIEFGATVWSAVSAASLIRLASNTFFRGTPFVAKRKMRRSSTLILCSFARRSILFSYKSFSDDAVLSFASIPCRGFYGHSLAEVSPFLIQSSPPFSSTHK